MKRLAIKNTADALYYRVRLVSTRLVVALMMLSCVGVHAASVAIEDVRLWRAPDHTRVVLDLSAAPNYKYFSLENPDRLVLDVNDSELVASLSSVELAGTPIKKLRGAKQADGRYRIVFDLRQKVEPKLFSLQKNSQYSDRLVIDLHDISAPKTFKTVDENNGRRDIVVAIDAGHGGEDPGASGPRRLHEKNVVMAIARLLKNRFDEEPGYRAVLIRDGDYYVSLKQRRDLARKHQADLFVSIHADAFKDKRVSGSSVYTLSQRGASSASAQFLADAENNADRIGGVELSGKDEMLTNVLLDLSMTATLDSSTKVAQDILFEMGAVARLHKNTVEHAAFAVLKSPDIPSVLVETGFISNPSEAKRLSSGKHQAEMASAIFQGVVNYFEKNATEGTWVFWKQRAPKDVAARLPAKSSVRSYKIKSGDTLSEIAARYSISLNELRRYNGITNDKIRIGQVIKIPPRH